MGSIVQPSEAETPAADAPAFRYVVPDWILHNIKTADELKGIEAKLYIVDDAEENGQRTPDGSQDAPREASAAEPGSKGTPHASMVQPDEPPIASDGASPSRILTHESPVPGSDLCRSRCFTIPRHTFEDVLDAAASIYVNQHSRNFISRGSALGLYCQMRHGYQFLDEVVVRMAQELQGSLVSLHPHELENMAMELYDQECTAVSEGRIESSSINSGERRPNTAWDVFAYTDKMFAARTERKAEEAETRRARKPVLALLEAARAKGAAERSSSCCPPPQTPPLILYIRDALLLFDTYKRRGRRILCRIRDAVNEQRENGHNVLMVIGVTHTDKDAEGQKVDAVVPWKLVACECSLCDCVNLKDCDSSLCDLGVPMRKLGARGMLRKSLMPLSVPQGWDATTTRSLGGALGSPVAAKLRSFKYRLQMRLAGYPSQPTDLLERDSDWLALLSEEATNGLFAKMNSDLEMQTAFGRIVGKTTRKQVVDLAVIKAAFLYPEEATETASAQDSEDETESSEDAQVDADSDEGSRNEVDISEAEETKRAKKAWDEKLSAIKRQTNEHEANILPYVVDPASLDADLDDVVLDQDVLARIKTLVHLSQLRPAAASKFLISQIRTTGALLYGPPGTGKTLLARAVARATGAHMLALSPATIGDKCVGESEKTIEAAFGLARRLFPCIIFFDEVDALFYRRSGDDKSWQRAQLTQFLHEMDGLTQDPCAPFVLAATNRPADLDSAFLRRLPHKVAFGAPDAAARVRILRVLLDDDDLDRETVDLDHLAARTPGFSGSDLRSLCGQAGLAWAVEQDLAGAAAPGKDTAACKVHLTDAHFRTALTHLRPSITPADLAALDEFTRQFGPAKKLAVA